ncbi:ParB/RepB/Spo0J family partition protein [Streptomyces poriferorum]|uniref:ParB/RepB/Spo0J family partition protein n=1 Tax=Streptomyces poriferorum TaxID=2798799 RepID=A0ABY9J2A8_9ACTN|nr:MULTISPECIES: ParB/RepB/Spo0J family partition protein [unclassified Streptomyces]MDP5317381.1 ParB/RepB/Spo0J family partition protein [Streptomyces sp. Alt4]WLQ61987.1 ParB/RepB/Spo0J family partition protein [Streptomyces sp. Alt2]
MSVADRLGTGSSFGGVPRGRSARGRAKAIVQGDVPSYELRRLPLEEVAPTPLNPRRNFGSEEDLTRFGEELRIAQLAACVAVSRSAYLRLWPEHEAQIGDSAYVLVNGERRFRSAVHVALDALDFVVRDELATSREEFVDHLLKENLEREDFDVVERARGVLELVRVCSEESEKGARTRAAKRLGRDRSWVTNQLALLELPAELQTMLSSGSLPERDGRLLARRMKEEPGLDGAGLLAHLKETREQEIRVREEEKLLLQRARQTADTGPSVLSADNTKPVNHSPALSSVLSADNTPRVAEAAQPASVRPPAPTPPAPAPAEERVLSTDNTTGTATSPAETGHQEKDETAVPADQRSLLLVRQLGASVEEQARTLASGLPPEELTQLIEELHSYV